MTSNELDTQAINRAELEAQFLNAEKFSTRVMQKRNGGMPYTSAIVETCDDYDIDLEDLKKLDLLSPLVLSEWEEEEVGFGNLKASSRLPIWYAYITL